MKPGVNGGGGDGAHLRHDSCCIAERPPRKPFRPPSGIGRTKPLVRLVLSQIGRRMTERLEQPGATARRH